MKISECAQHNFEKIDKRKHAIINSFYCYFINLIIENILNFKNNIFEDTYFIDIQYNVLIISFPDI